MANERIDRHPATKDMLQQSLLNGVFSQINNDHREPIMEPLLADLVNHAPDEPDMELFKPRDYQRQSFAITGA